MEHPDFGRICECKCHWDGSNIFCSCFGQCCEFEQKYADKDGVIDIARFGALVMEKRLALRGGVRARRKSKSQQRLEGRTIVAVTHAPNELQLGLDDGTTFVVRAVNGMNSLDPWERGPAGLDFAVKRDSMLLKDGKKS